MDDAPLSPTSEITWIAQLAQRVSDQQTGAQAFFDAHCQQLATAHARFRAQIETVVEQAAASAKRLAETEAELGRKAEETRQAGELVARQRAELDARQAKWEQARRQAAEQQQQQEARQAELARLQSDLQRRATELDDRQKAVAEAQSQTDIQRRKIAHGLKAQHAAQWREIQRQRAELERHDNGEVGRLERQLRGIERQRDALQEERESLAEQLQKQGLELAQTTRRASQLEDRAAELSGRLEARGAELESARTRQVDLTGQLEAARQQEAELASKWEVLRRRHEELLPELETLRGRCADQTAQLEAARSTEQGLRAELAAAVDRADRLAGELESLDDRCRRLEAAAAEPPGDERLAAVAAERDRLAGQLGEAREQLRAAEASAAGQSGGGDMQRRYEMALDDVRTLKKKNEQLEKNLLAARAAGDAPAVSGTLDWEAQKARLLAALENDSGGDDPEQAEERLRIERVIQETDKTVAAQEQEIEELKRLLENQGANLGSAAVGAAALGEILDDDEIIREERENLKRLQQQWEEKLRKAEIDLSVERAKIARERAELEERMHVLAESSGKGRGAKGDDGKDAKGGRWLAKLGLKDEKG
ncbi:MAG: hypothetical protein GXY25_17960 [Pirellulaceae bacterium]|jgi:chromosome segregation ATPase|nr:hypothetical protein [Thermoguttaceae bacterium]MDI9446176.1 hypothetical protein [Planctomycetota bacterium]NLZ02406.1 hypothetical protein [Pirellulaceae bacterium]